MKNIITLLLIVNILNAHIVGNYHCHVEISKLAASELLKKYIDIENKGEYLGNMYFEDKKSVIVLEKEHKNKPKKILKWWVRYEKDMKGENEDSDFEDDEKDFTIVLIDDKNIKYSVVIKNGCIAKNDTFKILPTEDVYEASLIVQAKNGRILSEDSHAIVKIWK